MSNGQEPWGLREIVIRLAGPIFPIGRSEVDAARLENLKTLTGLIESLLDDVRYVARDAVSTEASVRAIGVHARDFLDAFCGVPDAPGSVEQAEPGNGGSE